MLFGKKEPEKIKPDALVNLLDALFGKKLGELGSRARAIAVEMRSAFTEFDKAVDAFAGISAEPYIANPYFSHVNSIKSQKVQYTSVMGHIVGKASLEVIEGINPYDQYKQLLSNVDMVTNEVLQTNASFKTVLLCYSDHLITLTRSFSAIERSREALRREIESKSKEASEYAAVKERISVLYIKTEELKELESGLNALKDIVNSKDKGAIEKEETRLSESLAGMRFDLSGVISETARLSKEIGLLTLPLERSSKKLDHSSDRRKQLYPFIADPIGSIRDENDHKAFIALVNELKEAVEKGTVDTKNKEETLSLINKLLDSDTYGYISAFRSLQLRRSGIESEIRSLEGALGDIKSSRTDSGRVAQEIESISNRIKDTSASVALTKKSIEAMFLDYYRRPIVITS
jgi:hypothetical protein